MLSIYFGEMPEAVYDTAAFFEEAYDPGWSKDDFGRRVVGRYGLSRGAKTLLLIKNRPDKVFNASACGDNCVSFILEIARERDVTINLRHIMDFGKRRFTVLVLNDGRVVHGMYELLCAAGRYV